MVAKYIAISAAALCVCIVGCNPRPPKQVSPPRIEDSGEQDMGVVPQTEMTEAPEKDADEMTGEELHKHCCGQCEQGLAQDRTGQKAEEIPCADFTAILEEGCLTHFRDKPMQASECVGVGTPPKKAPSKDAANP